MHSRLSHRWNWTTAALTVSYWLAIIKQFCIFQQQASSLSWQWHATPSVTLTSTPSKFFQELRFVYIIVFQWFLNAVSTLFIKLGQFVSSQLCGPKCFENFVCGPWPKKFVHHWCIMISKLKALGGCSRHHLHRAWAYCGGRIKGLLLLQWQRLA